MSLFAAVHTLHPVPAVAPAGGRALVVPVWEERIRYRAAAAEVCAVAFLLRDYPGAAAEEQIPAAARAAAAVADGVVPAVVVASDVAPVAVEAEELQVACLTAAVSGSCLETVAAAVHHPAECCCLSRCENLRTQNAGRPHQGMLRHPVPVG